MVMRTSGKYQNKTSQRDFVHKYNPRLFSYCRTTAFYPESGNKVNSFMCTNAFQVAPPTSLENSVAWHRLQWAISQTCFVQQPNAPCRRKWPIAYPAGRCPNTTHIHTKQKQKSHCINSFFHSCSIFMTALSFCINYKKTENSCQSI